MVGTRITNAPKADEYFLRVTARPAQPRSPFAFQSSLPLCNLRSVQIEIINTGSELLLGRVLNTHQQWLCRELADRGYVVSRQTAVSDEALAIRGAVEESLSRADLIITTGGL